MFPPKIEISSSSSCGSSCSTVIGCMLIGISAIITAFILLSVFGGLSDGFRYTKRISHYSYECTDVKSRLAKYNLIYRGSLYIGCYLGEEPK